MKAQLFDAVARDLGVVSTRRGFVRLLGVGVALGELAATTRAEPTAAKRKHKKRKKKRKKRAPLTSGGRVVSDPCDVCGSGCAFTSLQKAIDAATPESTIRLCPEPYLEHVSVGKNLTLVGAGAERTVLDGGGAESDYAVLYVYDGAIVEVRGLTVRGGNSSTGGGIDNEATLTLEGVTVTDNKGGDGGGIFTHPGAALRLIDSRVSGNEASNGGGLWVDGGTVTLTRTAVTGNKAPNGGFGGGFHIYKGTVKLNESQVAGNEAIGAGSEGGGVYIFQGDLVLNGTPVTGNSAASGGGIYNSDGAVDIAPGSVTGNSPNNCAGEAVANCVN